MANESSNIKQEEEAIAAKAAAAATAYVHNQMKASGVNIRNKGTKKKGKGKNSKFESLPILEATKIIPEMGDHRLLGFKFMSNRVGFVHHFGVVSDNTRYLQTVSKTGTVFKKSRGGLQSQSYFDNIYEKSGALKILEEGLSKTRTRAITLQLQNMILKIEKQNG